MEKEKLIKMLSEYFESLNNGSYKIYNRGLSISSNSQLMLIEEDTKISNAQIQFDDEGPKLLINGIIETPFMMSLALTKGENTHY